MGSTSILSFTAEAEFRVYLSATRTMLSRNGVRVHKEGGAARGEDDLQEPDIPSPQSLLGGSGYQTPHDQFISL